MFFIIRNGEYLETEKKSLGDIEVPKRPHDNAIYVNNEWIIDADTYFYDLDKSEAAEFLKNTDWKIMRHKEQQELGVELSLTEEEYIELIIERQERRNLLNDIPD